MIRRPPRSTRTDTLFPYTTLFRSHGQHACRPTITAIGDVMWGMANRQHATQEAAMQDRLDPTMTMQALARSEEHTSELQSLMRISYAVFCLKKKKEHTTD